MRPSNRNVGTAGDWHDRLSPEIGFDYSCRKSSGGKRDTGGWT
jgi:hypothetical protein